MIELFYYTSANAQKILIFLEEIQIPYTLTAVDTTKGAQFYPDFVAIAPNSRIPVIIDHDPTGLGKPLTIFESGAILQYLAETTGALLPSQLDQRYAVLQWLTWQVAGLGPIGGQVIHFKNYAPRPIAYAIARYETENNRLLKVLDRQIGDKDFICEEYSIADIACFPWIYAHERRGQISYEEVPNLRRWFDRLRARPAIDRAYRIWADFTNVPVIKNYSEMSENARRILFGAHAVEDMPE